MIPRVLASLGIGVGALVVFVLGLNAFALWNLLPVILVVIGAITAARGRPKARALRNLVMFACATILAVVALPHLAWHFDLGGVGTGSSTSALIFLFIPIWSILIGGAVLVAGIVVLAFLGRIGVAHNDQMQRASAAPGTDARR